MLKHAKTAVAAITAVATIATVSACSPVMTTQAAEHEPVGVYTNPASRLDIPAPKLSVDTPVLSRSYPYQVSGLGHIEAVYNCEAAPNTIRVANIGDMAIIRIVKDTPEATFAVSVNGTPIEITGDEIVIPSHSAAFALEISITEPAPPEPVIEPVLTPVETTAPAYVEQAYEPQPAPVQSGPVSTYVWYTTPLQSNVNGANWDGTASWWNNWFIAHDFSVYGQAILGMHAGMYITIDDVQYVTGEPFQYPKLNSISAKRRKELGVTREEWAYVKTLVPTEIGYWWFTKQYDDGFYAATCDGEDMERMVPLYRV